jgi:ABC-type antimicrobial peptide transport system permease subunit
MRDVERTLPIYNVRTMDEVFAGTVATQRVVLLLLGVFASLALLLAAVGLYGVLSYSVGQRTREFGVRLAIGATPRTLLTHVLRGGFRLAALGLAFGLAGALLLARLMQSLPSAPPPCCCSPSASSPAGCLRAGPRASTRSSRCVRNNPAGEENLRSKACVEFQDIDPAPPASTEDLNSVASLHLTL